MGDEKINLTADTVTDEPIHELRESVAPMSSPRPRALRTQGDLAIIDACDRALTPYPEHAERRVAARARCAAILNARAGSWSP